MCISKTDLIVNNRDDIFRLGGRQSSTHREFVSHVKGRSTQKKYICCGNGTANTERSRLTKDSGRSNRLGLGLAKKCHVGVVCTY